jgi:hypothetical protein
VSGWTSDGFVGSSFLITVSYHDLTSLAAWMVEDMSFVEGLGLSGFRQEML